MTRIYDLNERAKYLARVEGQGVPLYVAGQGVYHLIGSVPNPVYDDVRKSLCGITGVLGRYGITDDPSGLAPCPDCQALQG